MLKTRFTEEFGFKYPVVCGGMMGIGIAELVAPVADAGALGFLTALTQSSPEELVKEVERTRGMTDQPFGVNLTILPTINPVPYDEYADAIVASGVQVVETAGRSPEPYMPTFKSGGIKVIHKCTSVRHALKAEKVGVDAISIDGFECAGHPGEDDIPGLILIPAAANQLSIPMLASGGFGDGRGLAAALMLGADAINMGSRFMATKEAPLHQNIKDKLVEASELDTTLINRSFRNTSRVYKNSIAEEVAAKEQAGAEFSDIQELVAGTRGRNAMANGDLEGGIWTVGMVAGLINDIPTVEELITRISADAEEIIQSKMKLIA
ncbi:MAG TPA: nitronate monooxygenase family protein [Arenicellales bacterium]|jgi:nitronate monooxygenase|nr:nitronate monooxygenase family protein [Pseudomonadales bacterium]MDP6316769.1 nitronate monooxygenase family protein [Pseudomonadales bacterium]MDP7313529.1 nitronate monooxygenase family protein [Pseudomonadales bacterium]HJL53385.1 nitronate monooxygenase family protein [Arenicellales bacterium]|tara:strand:+ start:4398 stop:5366 length:969 start_codon:yes stop_codon:yes gene_type:complete